MDIQKPEDVVAAINGSYKNGWQCRELARKIRIHARGEVPVELITERRPSEPEEIKSYRVKIYQPITKNPVNKVIHSLEKIRRAQDWSIQYKTDEVPAKIADDETMERYCEEKYPGYTSVTNWAFAELLKQSLIDANGIVAVVLEKLPKSKTEYAQPVAKFFESDQIVDWCEGEYVVLKSRDTTTYTTKQGRGKKVNTNGSVYYILTENDFVRYEQTGGAEYTAKCIYHHNIGELPAWKVGGLYLERKNNDTIFESRIAAMVPGLDEAAREYSDLQAEIVQHIHSEKYAYTNTECPDCKGTGHILDKDGKPSVCDKCHGTGKVLNTSPYGLHLVNAAAIGETQVPTPPIGYVQKDTSIAELQDKRIRDHIYDALAAVNMEFLAEAPLSQSGTAKEVDKDELNNFVNAVAEDLVRNIDKVYYFIAQYRYMMIVPDKEKRRALIPTVNVPTKFDIVSTTIAMQNLQAARQANVNPEILRELEIDYAKKQFNVDPEIAERVETTFTLDPLFGIAEENKMTMLQNGGITQNSYIVSCNIHAFVRRAIFENKDFCKMEYDKKVEVLAKFAEEVEKEAEKKAAEAAESDFGGLGNGGGTSPQPKDKNAAKSNVDDKGNPIEKEDE